MYSFTCPTVRQPHHATLGGFFLNHPPISRFTVTVTGDHPLTAGLPPTFEAVDELYLIELQDPETTQVLLTTELAADPSPPGFGFAYDFVVPFDRYALPPLPDRRLRRNGSGALLSLGAGVCLGGRRILCGGG